MNYTTILNKCKDTISWIYKHITNKFTRIFIKIIDKFPFLKRNPLLKYALIPVLFTLFLILRYSIKFILNEFATWTSNFVLETSDYLISEKTIIISIVIVFISLRILRFLNQRKKEKVELNIAES